MSKRVYVRQPELLDQAEFLEKVRHSRAIHTPWVCPPDTEELFALYLERMQAQNNVAYLICEASTHAIIGVVNVTNIIMGAFCSAYLGYYVFTGYERRGLMREGLLVAMEQASQALALHRLEANIQPDNLASVALVQSCGFSKEGYSPRYLKVDGEWRDHERWAIILEA